MINELTHFARQTGPTLSPFNSWLQPVARLLSLRMGATAPTRSGKLGRAGVEELLRLPSHPQRRWPGTEAAW
jgi:hypothetical protein